MSDTRYATADELANVRERLARVEGGHGHLSNQMAVLSDRIDSTRDSLSQKIDATAAQTRTEITTHVDRTLQGQSVQIQSLNSEVSGMAGNIKFMGWTLFFGVTVITGLLGWGQIGDWAWGEVKTWYVGVSHHVDAHGQSITTFTLPPRGSNGPDR